MRFKVIRPFNLLGSVRAPGQIVELDVAHASRLRSMRLIGSLGPELAVKPPAEKAIEPRPERAVKEPQERRGRKKRAKDEADADSAAGH
jgi:hypothetical protein